MRGNVCLCVLCGYLFFVDSSLHRFVASSIAPIMAARMLYFSRKCTPAAVEPGLKKIYVRKRVKRLSGGIVDGPQKRRLGESFGPVIRKG